MAVFTKVSEAELTAWLSDYSLGQLLELQGILSGIENTNYFVTTSNGRFVLTLFEKLGADELPFYLNLMAHLARHGIPCPNPMANRHNQFLGTLKGKPACIVSRLSGKSTTAPDLAQCTAIGAMLGQMHIAGQSFSQIMPNPRGAAWRTATAPQVRPFLDEQQAALGESLGPSSRPSEFLCSVRIRREWRRPADAGEVQRLREGHLGRREIRRPLDRAARAKGT